MAKTQGELANKRFIRRKKSSARATRKEETAQEKKQNKAGSLQRKDWPGTGCKIGNKPRATIRKDDEAKRIEAPQFLVPPRK